MVESSNAMPNSFCEFWWQIQEELMPRRVDRRGLQYLDIPESKEDEILTRLRLACRQLGVPNLFCPSDEEILKV